MNCVTVVDGPVGNLQHPLDHYPFSKGLKHWFTRHNSYSTFEAQQIVQNRTSQESFSLRAAFLSVISTVVVSTRKSFLSLSRTATNQVLLLYILKRGFLDGRPGFTYALLQSIYEAMIVLKVQGWNAWSHQLIYTVKILLYGLNYANRLVLVSTAVNWLNGWPPRPSGSCNYGAPYFRVANFISYRNRYSLKQCRGVRVLRCPFGCPDGPVV